MQERKLFSDKELKYLQDQDFLKAKSIIIDKISSLFSGIERQIGSNISVYQNSFPEGTLFKAGKISKGENYKGLPYIVLDYPRLFTTKSVFAFRTMFWWGNFLSTTLHMEGNALEQLRPRFKKTYESLSAEAWYISVGESPWEYHYNNDNYQLIANLEEGSYIKHFTEASFIKLSKYSNLEEWSNFQQFSTRNFDFLMQLLFR